VPPESTEKNKSKSFSSTPTPPESRPGGQSFGSTGKTKKPKSKDLWSPTPKTQNRVPQLGQRL
jgi:hypothetical protein